MLLAALRDLRWRRKRFLITVLGTALVFAMSLLMSGLAEAFTVEIDHTLADQRAEWWVAPTGVAGPFSAGSGITSEQVAAVATSPGVETADGVLFGGATVQVGQSSEFVDVNVFGVEPGGLGEPVSVIAGSPTPTPGTVVVPKRLEARVGDTIRVRGASALVGGVVDKASLVGGSPTVFVTMSDAQQLLVGGRPLVSMVLVRGTPSSLPSELKAFSRSQTSLDLARPLASASQSVELIRTLLWIVAALIIGSVVYLTALERTRDIAVFKATGVTTPAIGAGVCLQAIIVALAASLVGGVLAPMIAPRFPLDVVISSGSLVLLPLLAVVVGLVAGIAGVARIASVDPASAFGCP